MTTIPIKKPLLNQIFISVMSAQTCLCVKTCITVVLPRYTFTLTTGKKRGTCVIIWHIVNRKKQQNKKQEIVRD